MSTDAQDGAGPWPQGYDRLILAECASTMVEAARRAPMLDRPTWIMAHAQTEGRGRRGRAWTHRPGNLAATLIFRPECTPAEAGRRSFLAANALFEALAIYVDRNALAHKWPNDVLMNGGKVAGILLESSGRGPFVDWLAIGVGVNLAAAPDDDGSGPFAPVSVTAQGGPQVAPEVFLATLADTYATQESLLDRLGFPKLRDEWLEHAARLGEVITARTGKEEVTGLFETVDDEGNLVLRVGAERRRIAAADVHF